MTVVMMIIGLGVMLYGALAIISTILTIEKGDVPPLKRGSKNRAGGAGTLGAAGVIGAAGATAYDDDDYTHHSAHSDDFDDFMAPGRDIIIDEVAYGIDHGMGIANPRDDFDSHHDNHHF